jgi:hypothetical protein
MKTVNLNKTVAVVATNAVTANAVTANAVTANAVTALNTQALSVNASTQVFTIAGTSIHENGQIKMRFANNAARVKTLVANKHTNISLYPLNASASKIDATMLVLCNANFVAQYTYNASTACAFLQQNAVTLQQLVTFMQQHSCASTHIDAITSAFNSTLTATNNALITA